MIKNVVAEGLVQHRSLNVRKGRTWFWAKLKLRYKLWMGSPQAEVYKVKTDKCRPVIDARRSGLDKCFFLKWRQHDMLRKRLLRVDRWGASAFTHARYMQPRYSESCDYQDLRGPGSIEGSYRQMFLMLGGGLPHPQGLSATVGFPLRIWSSRWC